MVYPSIHIKLVGKKKFGRKGAQATWISLVKAVKHKPFKKLQRDWHEVGVRTL